MCPTLVERTSGYLMLIKMNDATAASAMEDFSAALNGMPLAMRKSMIYHQGREMARHTEIPQRTGVAIFFCYRTALGSAVATKISTA
jgi:IS30 family transposase